MRFHMRAALLVALILAGCDQAPAPKEDKKSDPPPPAQTEECFVRMPDGHGVKVPCK